MCCNDVCMWGACVVMMCACGGGMCCNDVCVHMM